MQLYLHPLTFGSWISPFDLYNVELLFRIRGEQPFYIEYLQLNRFQWNVKMYETFEKILFRIIWKNKDNYFRETYL